MSLPLLQTIHAHGEALCDALDAGDLDEVVRLAAERQAVLDELAATPRPSPFPAAWADLGGKLTAQSHRLAHLSAAHEHELSDALTHASRRRKAHVSYEKPAPPSSRLRAIHG